MDESRIHNLCQALEHRGIDTATLRDLQQELDVVERPPGLLGRLRDKIASAIGRQWSHVWGEVTESGEALTLIARQLRGKEPLSPEETDMVKAQLLDFFRLVPAGMFAAANASLPIPGTSVLTPVALQRMGLLPSRWREARVLAILQKESKRLSEEGHSNAAGEVEALRRHIAAEADAREDVGRNADLLSHWDANQNNIWDEDEILAYREELARSRGMLFSHGTQKRWYMQYKGQVFGPVRASGLVDQVADLDDDLLICYDGETGWVDLKDFASGESQI